MKTVLRRPFLSVIGPTGTNLVERLGSALIGVRITDMAGYESDECVIMVRRRPPFMAPPAKGTRYVVSVGWSAVAAAMTGIYTVERVSFVGDPMSGQEMHVVCRASDFIDALKQVDSEHFDEENGHATYGDIFRTLAGQAGMEAVIAPEIDAVPLSYRLRWKQSIADFATQLGDDLGAVVKPQGGKLTVRPRGRGQSASGRDLPPIVVRFEPSYAFMVDVEPRYAYREVAVGWFDGSKGRIQDEETETSAEHSRLALPHPYPTQGEASQAAAALGQEFGRHAGTGSFEMAGEPRAVAEAPVLCQGFGPGIDDVDWIAAVVVHDVMPESGWTTTIDTETRETT